MYNLRFPLSTGVLTHRLQDAVMHVGQGIADTKNVVTWKQLSSKEKLVDLEVRGSLSVAS